MHSFDIDLNNISKIEGHTCLEVKARAGRVVSCKLKINQGKRFLAEAVLGKRYGEVSPLMSRICGTCSSAHVVCAIKAIENAFGIKPTKQTVVLRKLLLNANHLRDHAMHLYFFVLPDLFGLDSVLDFGKEYHEWIHDGLEVKGAGNYLSTIVGGRAVHPPAAIIGGFNRFANDEEIKLAIEKLKFSRKKVLKLVDLLYNKRPFFERPSNHLALFNRDYNFYEGKIKTSKGTIITEKNFLDHLEKVVLPYSSAEAFEFESREYLVGALARMNLNKDNLNKSTLRAVRKYLGIFPSNNIYDNNLSQAIEMLLIIDNSIELLRGGFKKEKPKEVVAKEGVGLGVVEAPRGHLFYKIEFDSKGRVKNSVFCIPTQQNVIHMEKSISLKVEDCIRKNKSREEISLEVEKIIRAYDPCMNCASHFLKIAWI